MRISIIILYLCFYSNVKCYESDESIEVFASAEDRCDCEEYENYYGDVEFEDAYDERLFYTELARDNGAGEVAQNKSKVSLNCFGLGGTFSNWMENFLKNEANGSKALKVVFYSRSRSQPERARVHLGKYFSLDETDFDITKRTVFIVHGFFAHANDKWIIDMEKALLTWVLTELKSFFFHQLISTQFTQDDLNIFVVDWSDGANTWNYLKAAVNTKTVGDQIAT